MPNGKYFKRYTNISYRDKFGEYHSFHYIEMFGKMLGMALRALMMG